MDTRTEIGAKVLRPAFRWHGQGGFEGDLGQPCLVMRAACGGCGAGWHLVASRAPGRCPVCDRNTSVTATPVGA